MNSHDVRNQFQEKNNNWLQQLEDKTRTVLASSLPFIIHLNGHNFRSWLKYFMKPYDELVDEAMLNAAHDTLYKFRGSYETSSVYVQSNEMIFVFSKPPDREIKTFKIMSLFAGYASARFNHHISRIFEKDSIQRQGPDLNNQIKQAAEYEAYFGGCIYQLEKIDDCLDIILMKRNICLQNSHANFERCISSEAQLQWKKCSAYFKFGILLKIGRDECIRCLSGFYLRNQRSERELETGNNNQKDHTVVLGKEDNVDWNSLGKRNIALDMLFKPLTHPFREYFHPFNYMCNLLQQQTNEFRMCKTFAP